MVVLPLAKSQTCLLSPAGMTRFAAHVTWLRHPCFVRNIRSRLQGIKESDIQRPWSKDNKKTLIYRISHLLENHVSPRRKARYALWYIPHFTSVYLTLTRIKVRLGKSGLKISRIVLGTMTYGTPEWQGWVLGEEDGLSHIKAAFDAGINAFDTSNVSVTGSLVSFPPLSVLRYTRMDCRRRFWARRSRSSTYLAMR